MKQQFMDTNETEEKSAKNSTSINNKRNSALLEDEVPSFDLANKSGFKRRPTQKQAVQKKQSIHYSKLAFQQESQDKQDQKMSFESSAVKNYKHYRSKTHKPLADGQSSKNTDSQILGDKEEQESLNKKGSQYNKQTRPASGNKISPELINLLFTKQYKQLNPYILALNEIYNNGDKYPEKERIEELCYIGIGKSVVEYKKNTRPPYSRVNLLIRQFMIEVADHMVLAKKKKQPEKVFLRCNDNAMGFRFNQYDKRLSSHMSESEYRETIKGINKIIEGNFLNFKKRREVEISWFNYASTFTSILGILVLMVYILMWDSYALMVLAWILIFSGILLSLAGTVLKESDLKGTSNVVSKIWENIEIFLDKINVKYPGLKWKCGIDFYWLQITILQAKPMNIENKMPKPHYYQDLLDVEGINLQSKSHIGPSLNQE